MITINDIDVFILSYNREGYIAESIYSLKKQTVGDFPITILDNGSSDNTKEVVKKLKYNDIKFVGSDKNNGVIWNLKRAQKLSNKKYTMLFHDDDLLHPSYLEVAIKTINNHNVSVVCGGMKATYSPRIKNFTPISKTIIFKDSSIFSAYMYAGFPVNFSSVIYKTNNFKKLSVEQEIYGKIADRPMIIDAINDRVGLLPGSCVQYRLHDSQDSQNSKTGPYPNEVIALHEKYKRIIFDSSKRITKFIFLVYYYYYLTTEFKRFYKPQMSLNDYVELSTKELKLQNKHLALSKLFYFLKFYLFFKIYRAIKRKYGEYS
jgi:glycosyltransferase involved in cell wall biosynthesis